MQHRMVMDRRCAYFDQVLQGAPVMPLSLAEAERLLFDVAACQDVRGNTRSGEPLFKVTRNVVNSIAVWVSRNLEWFASHPARGPRDAEVMMIANHLRWPLLEISRHRDWLHPKSVKTINSSCSVAWATSRH